MKITNLSCPSCGGRLEPMKENPQIMVCEYCGSQFVIENDVPVHYHIHPYPTGQIPTLRENPSSGNPLAAGIIFAVSLIAVTVIGITVHEMSRQNTHTPSLSFPEAGYEYGYAAEEEEEPQENSFSPLCEAFIEAIFQKDSSLITETDLAQITYLRVQTGSEASLVEYSFQNLYEDGTASFDSFTIWLEPLSWSSHDLSAFTGLQRLDIREERAADISFEKLSHLKGLICRGITPDEAALLIPDPEQIVELSLVNPQSLDGIAAFPNLQILSLERIPAPDLRQLTVLKDLRSLSIEETEEDPFSLSEEKSTSLTDYSPLSVLTGLEHLELSSSAIRDFGFLKSLTGLTSLSISDSDALNLEPLRELTQLISLELKDNHSLQDYKVLKDLQSLKTLILDKGTSQPDLDLSSLTGLETLDMSGFISISFLGRMSGLKHLSLHGCNADEIQSLSGLTGLESLTCYSIWTYAVPLRNMNFLDQMTSLRYLDLDGGTGSIFGSYQLGTEILGEISNVWNHPGLETLILNHCTFGIDFDRLQENPSLRHLEMKEVNLKENFYVESYNGMTDIWYDDVALNDHIGFLTNYPNLEKLYLDGNQLTDLQFASSLKHLTHLGIRDNYITELAPLNQLEELEYLDIRTNPISGTFEANEEVVILE